MLNLVLFKMKLDTLFFLCSYGKVHNKTEMLYVLSFIFWVEENSKLYFIDISCV